MEQTRRWVDFLFLNLGHFFDHFLILIYATVAMAVATDRQVDIPGFTSDWDMTYADLVLFSTAGFVAFGLFSLPAGWLADRWSRTGMISVFFLGMGAAAILTSFAETPWQLAAGILLTGMLGAIYHPVGLGAALYPAADRRLRLARGLYRTGCRLHADRRGICHLAVYRPRP
jgi:MFS family permease